MTCLTCGLEACVCGLTLNELLKTEPPKPPIKLRKDGKGPVPPLKKKGQKNKPFDEKRVVIPKNFTTIQAMEMMQQTLYRQVIILNAKRTLERHEVEMIKIIKNMLPEINRELLYKNDAENDDDFKTQLKQAAQIAGLMKDDEEND